MNDKDYAIFLIISEVVITTIAFVGAYFILKPVLTKKSEEKDKKEETKDETTSANSNNAEG